MAPITQGGTRMSFGNYDENQEWSERMGNSQQSIHVDVWNRRYWDFDKCYPNFRCYGYPTEYKWESE